MIIRLIELTAIEDVPTNELNQGRLDNLIGGHDPFDSLLNSQLNPITLDGPDKPHRIIDGRHRIYLARQRGYKQVPARCLWSEKSTNQTPRLDPDIHPSQSKETVSFSQHHVGWQLWWLWVLASIGGFLVGVLVSIIPAGVTFEILRLADSQILGAALATALAGIIIWIVVGISQWAVLRRHISDAKGWITISSACAIIGIPLGLVSEWSVSGISNTFTPLALSIAGSIIGLGQWIFWRRYHPRAGWWILANILGLSLLITYPLVTGVTLVWLLRKIQESRP